MDDHLQVDDGYLLNWHTVEQIVINDVNHIQNYRYGQALYNVLSARGQLGLPGPWPELFYQPNGGNAYRIFRGKFDIIDGYIVPKK